MLDQIRREIESDSYYKQNFSNDGQRFVAWYLRRILLRDDVATRDDITDGQNDKQIDALIVRARPGQLAEVQADRLAWA